jgi:hypothetical protein
MFLQVKVASQLPCCHPYLLPPHPAGIPLIWPHLLQVAAEQQTLLQGQLLMNQS